MMGNTEPAAFQVTNARVAFRHGLLPGNLQAVIQADPDNIAPRFGEEFCKFAFRSLLIVRNV